MRPSLILAGIVISSFETLCDASKSKSKSAVGSKSGASGTKSASVSPVKPPSSPIQLDRSTLMEIYDITMTCASSPLRVIDKDTKKLSIDFDVISSDSERQCDLFLPASSTLYDPDSWKLPLQRLSDPENVLNLARKLKEIQDLMESEGVEQYCAVSVNLSRYIQTVAVSFAQLDYLLSRLRNTPIASKHQTKGIYKIVLDHMDGLAKFCHRISSCATDFGMAIPITSLSVPGPYYQHFLQIILHPELNFADYQVQGLNDFFFSVYGANFFTALTKELLAKISTQIWLPLPFKFMRHRMVFEDCGGMQKFILNWRLKVFTGHSPLNFSHLVDLGSFLQLGLIDLETLMEIHDQIVAKGLKASFKFDSPMVEFLAFAISAPWLLPSDPESALLIGNYAPKNNKPQELDDARKIEIITRLFSFYLKDLEPAVVDEELHENFCQLVQMLDFVYPGIASNIWPVVPVMLNGQDQSEEKAWLKGDDYVQIVSGHLDSYSPEDMNNSEKLGYIRHFFNIKSTIDSLYLNSESLYKIVEFFSEVLSDSIDSIEDSDDANSFDADLKGIIDECVCFFDAFLLRFAIKPIINPWHQAYDFIPTKIYVNLNRLWYLDAYNSKLLENNQRVVNNVFNLVHHSLYFANNFLLANKGMIAMFGEIPFSGNVSTPKCIISSGKASEYNTELLDSLLNYFEANSIDYIPDYVFRLIQIFFAMNGSSMEDTEFILTRILDSQFKFNISSPEFSGLFGPSFIIALENKLNSPESSAEARQFCQSVFRKFVNSIDFKVDHDIIISPSLMFHMSTFLGAFPFIHANIVPGNENIDISDIQKAMDFDSLEDLSNQTLILISLFVESANSGITLHEANKLLAVIIDLMKKAVDLDKAKLKTCNDWIYALNSLFLFLARNPQVNLPGNEEKALIAIYHFYSVVERTVAYSYDNIFRLIKRPGTVEALCRKMISYSDYLPKNVFELPVSPDLRSATKIQSGFAEMLASLESEVIDHEYLHSFIYWVISGKAIFESIMKILKLVKLKPHFNVIFMCFRVVEAMFESTNFTTEQKKEALASIFNESNSTFVLSLLGSKNTFEIDYFMRVLSNDSYPFIDSVIENCKTESWYPVLRAHIYRYKILNLPENTVENRANFSYLAEEHMKHSNQVLKSVVPLYMIKRQTFLEVDALINNISNIPVLLKNNVDNDPLQKLLTSIACFFFQSDRPTDLYFRIYPDFETYVSLMKLQTDVFRNKGVSRDLFLFNILKSMRNSDLKNEMLESYFQFVTHETINLSENSIIVMLQWFDAKTISNAFPVILKFLQSITTVLFDLIFPIATTTSKSIPALDEILHVFATTMINSKSLLTSDPKIHMNLLQRLDRLKNVRIDLLENCSCLVEYLTVVVKKFNKNSGIMALVGKLMIDLSNFYDTRKDIWIIIWTVLQKHMSVSLAENSQAKFILGIVNGKSDNWKSFADEVPNMHLTDSIRLMYVVKAIDIFPEIEYDILTLLPDTFKYEYFKDFEDFEVLFDYIDELFDGLTSGTAGISLDIFKKLLIWIDFECNICSLSSRNVRKLIEYSRFKPNYEEMLVSSFLRNSTNMIASIDCNDKLLAVIYQLHDLGFANPVELELLMTKLVEDYTRRVEGSSILYGDYLDSLNEISDTGDRLDPIFEDLDKLSESMSVLLITRLCDSNPFVALKGVFELMKRLDQYIFANNERSEERSKIADVVVGVIASKISSHGVMPLLLLINNELIELLILTFSYHVEEKIEDFKYIISELFRFAPFHVSYLFFQQIADLDLRPDVCFLNKAILGRYHQVVHDGFTKDEQKSWTQSYLLNFLNSPKSAKLDPKYFELMLVLIRGIGPTGFSLSELFHNLRLVLLFNSGCIIPILNFVDEFKASLSASFKLDYKLILDQFLTIEVLKALLSKDLPADALKRSISFINNIKKQEGDYYAEWNAKRRTNADIAQLFDERFKLAELKAKVSMHNVVARRMIEKISQCNFGDIASLNDNIEKLKKLDFSTLDAEVVSDLASLLIDFFKAAPEGEEFNASVKVAVHVLISLPTLEFFANSLELAGKVFDLDILVALINKSENAEMVKEVIFAFKHSINITHIATIKANLAKYTLDKDMEILRIAAKNSNPMMLTKYFQNAKNCPLEFKLSLLSASEVILGNDKILDLLNYFKNLMSSNNSDPDAVVKAFLNNRSITSCFTSSGSANAKNRDAIVAFIKTRISFRTAGKFISEIDSVVSKTVLKLLFAPSGTEGPLIPPEADMNVNWEAFFVVFLNETLLRAETSNQTPSFLKAFRLYEEIDARFKCLKQSDLEGLVDKFAAHLEIHPLPFSSPQTVYAFTKLSRRIVSMKGKRNVCLDKLFITRKNPRASLVEAFLRGQFDSENIDWELLERVGRAFKDKTNFRIKALLKHFEDENRCVRL